MVKKRQFWVVISVVKKGSFGFSLVWLKTDSSVWLLVCLKRGSFGSLLGWLNRVNFGGY